MASPSEKVPMNELVVSALDAIADGTEVLRLDPRDPSRIHTRRSCAPRDSQRPNATLLAVQ